MARAELILQAVTSANHATSVQQLFRNVHADSALISVGFVRETGVEALEAVLRPIAQNVRFFVGIRNEITTVQGIKRLLGLGAQVHAVDTGARNPIFHPKLYLAVQRGQRAGLIIGSANLTHEGLHNNIEASSLITLDLASAEDRAFLDGTLASFDVLPRQFPQHVFRISDEAAADALFDAGRLADETVVPTPPFPNAVRRGKRDTLPRMNLHRVARRARPKQPRQIRTPARVPGGPSVATAAVQTTEYRRVWESKGLSERDLNIPTGKTTNPTGSILLKKGAMEGIDQRHYFRDEVFQALVWTLDSKRPRWERAYASFEIVVKNLNYGKFELQLSHDTHTTSRTYLERNGMTHVHWGAARSIIAHRDLLGRTMYLYRKDTNPPEFLLEID